jgi:integrase/recombinase XerC
MQRILERYAEEAGLKNLSVQVIRHTFAKNLIDAGVGLERVAALLGHNSLNTTLIYFVSGAHDLAQAVEKLGKPKNNPHTEVKNG